MAAQRNAARAALSTPPSLASSQDASWRTPPGVRRRAQTTRTAARTSPQPSPYQPPSGRHPAAGRFGTLVAADFERVPKMRPVVVGDDDKQQLNAAGNDYAIFCEMEDRLLFGNAIRVLFEMDDRNDDMQFTSGLRARLVEIVRGVSSPHLPRTFSIRQYGLQLIRSDDEYAWPLVHSDPAARFGGNWWSPTHYCFPAGSDWADRGVRAEDRVIGADDFESGKYGPVLTSAHDIEGVLTKMAQFDVAGALHEEQERRVPPQLADSRAVAKMARTLENATLRMESESPQALLSSGPGSADATRLAAAAANYAQALHARECRAWQMRAEEAEQREKFCFLCLQKGAEHPNRKTAAHYKRRNDPAPCNNACLECQMPSAPTCVVCHSTHGFFLRV